MNKKMRATLLAAALTSTAVVGCTSGENQTAPETTFEVSFSSQASTEPLDGRVILILAKNDESEPRFQVTPGVNAIQIFGIEAADLAPGSDIVIDKTVFGYPNDSLAELPDGDYFVQALLHKYDTFNLSNGKNRQTTDGSRRRTALGPISWQPLQCSTNGFGQARLTTDRDCNGSGDPAD